MGTSHTHPELVEKVARAIHQVSEQDGGPPYDALTLIWRGAHEQLAEQAIAALTAINASGTHVVAPVVATEEMVLDGVDAWHRTKAPLDKELSAVWSAMLFAAREGK